MVSHAGPARGDGTNPGADTGSIGLETVLLVHQSRGRNRPGHRTHRHPHQCPVGGRSPSHGRPPSYLGPRRRPRRCQQCAVRMTRVVLRPWPSSDDHAAERDTPSKASPIASAATESHAHARRSPSWPIHEAETVRIFREASQEVAVMSGSDSTGCSGPAPRDRDGPLSDSNPDLGWDVRKSAPAGHHWPSKTAGRRALSTTSGAGNCQTKPSRQGERSADPRTGHPW